MSAGNNTRFQSFSKAHMFSESDPVLTWIRWFGQGATSKPVSGEGKMTPSRVG